MFGRIHDGLVLIKRGIQQNRYPGLLPEGFNELVIPGRYQFVDRLQSARPVHMRNGRQHGLLFFFYRKYFFHKRNFIRYVKIFHDIFFEYGRRKGAEAIPPFYF